MRTRACVASNSKVNARGMRIATPLEGPSPGKAPIIVPRMHPTIAKLRVVNVSAMPKPRAKF